MKQIASQLLTNLKKPGRSTGFCTKIVSREGDVVGFTSVDDVVRFHDGFHYVEYMPNNELFPQNMEETVEVSEADNSELHGKFDDIFEQKMLAGKFFGAEVTVYRVCYLKLSLGPEVVSYGTLGKVDYQSDASGTRKLEWFGLDHMLEVKQNDVTSLTCRHEFGDEGCKMPFTWEAYTIAEVDDPRLRFRLTGPLHTNPLYFLLGVIRFNNGDNLGAELEVEEWEPTGTGGWVKLSFVTPYNVEVGELCSVRRDCDKTESTCKGYANVVNMDAEHLMPVQDTGLMIPGAYVKSNNAL